MERDGGNGSALRIRPEPSKLRNLARSLPDAALYPESSMVSYAIPAKPRSKRHRLYLPYDDTMDFIDQNRKKKFPLCPWRLPRLKYVPVSQQGYS